jgi:hypothetical protein
MNICKDTRFEVTFDPERSVQDFGGAVDEPRIGRASPL